jgi:DNA (cytosine-5)-methyltransferase 1
MKQFSVISLFSGAGGLDLGFKQAGFNIIWANDFDKDAVNTYKQNIGDHIVLGDITKISSSDIPDKPDIILGGFPCQGFSINNKNRSMQDSRNFLYKELYRVVKDKQPLCFLGENVKGLLSMENGKIIDLIKKDFEEIGYYVKYKVFNTSEYGIPQNRERVILYGNKIGFDGNLNIPTSKQKISTKDAIEFLSEIPITYNKININNRTIYNHIASTNVHDTFFARKNPPKQEEICDYLCYYKKINKISTNKIDMIFGYKHTAGHWFRKDNNSGSIPKPHDWWQLKRILNFDDTYDKQVTELELKQVTFEQSLRITNWDTPSDTITATTPEIHINKQRRLSVRECAILQSFPDDFIFTGSLNSMYRQVGNAVPPVFAKKIALEIKNILINYKKNYE